MSTENSIIARLKYTSVTHGWDFVVAYGRREVNHLFLQQYIDKTSSGDEYNLGDITSSYGVEFRDVKIGPPLISFENSVISSSRVTVRRKIFSGTLIQTDGGQVIRWENITPANNYAFLMTIDLAYGTGTVTTEQEVYINFKNGYLVGIEGLSGIPAEILERFRQIFASGDNKYVLGKIVGQSAPGDIYPRNFVVRTQPNPSTMYISAADYGDGAVLLFIATNLNPNPGSIPSDNYTYLLADNRSATLVMASATFYNNILAPHFKSYITNATLQYTAPNSGAAIPGRLQFTAGYLESQSIITGRYSGVGVGYSVYTNYQSSTNNGVAAKAQLQMAGFSISSDTSQTTPTRLSGSFPANQPFTQYFRGDYTIYFPEGYNYGIVTDAYPFFREGVFTANLTLENNYTLTFRSTSTLNLSTQAINQPLLTIISDDPLQKMAQEFTTALNSVNFLQLPAINTFYVQHILFPSQDILTFDRAAIPEDIIMFGDVKPSLTNLLVTPAETLLVAGKTLQFTASPASGVTWSSSPAGFGSISSTGLYTAPAAVNVNTPRIVKITASNSSGNTSALVTVVPSALEISPAVLVIRQNSAPASVQFQPAIADSTQTIQRWALESDYGSQFTGIISQQGVYTPPTTYLEDEYVFATVKATLVNGTVASAIMCIIGKGVVAEFQVSPDYAYSLAPNQTAVFRATSRDFVADEWGVYPALGSVNWTSTPGSTIVTTGTYQAPASVPKRTQAFVLVTRTAGTYRADHVVVDLDVN